MEDMALTPAVEVTIKPTVLYLGWSSSEWLLYVFKLNLVLKLQ